MAVWDKGRAVIKRAYPAFGIAASALEDPGVTPGAGLQGVALPNSPSVAPPVTRTLPFRRRVTV
jgi:hypothetical protein